MSAEMSEASPALSLSDLELRKELNRLGIEVGPIVPSTRKIYEKKLQYLLTGSGSMENGDNLVNGTMNGGGTPLRETTPLMNAENNSSPNPTPTSAPNEQGSDDDEEPSESARLLTPREMHSFRRSFKSVDSPDALLLRQRRDLRECSPPLGDQNVVCDSNGTIYQKVDKNDSSTVKRFGFSLLILAMTCAFIVAMFWMRERLLPIFDGGTNDVQKGQ